MVTIMCDRTQVIQTQLSLLIIIRANLFLPSALEDSHFIDVLHANSLPFLLSGEYSSYSYSCTFILQLNVLKAGHLYMRGMLSVYKMQVICVQEAGHLCMKGRSLVYKRQVICVQETGHCV